MIPDSEDEEEACASFCTTASQAAVDALVQEGAGGDTARAARQAAEAAGAWQDAVVLRGPAQLTLLLPRDQHGELGLDTRCVPLPRAAPGHAAGELTAGQLLRLVHEYYQEQVRACRALAGCCRV